MTALTTKERKPRKPYQTITQPLSVASIPGAELRIKTYCAVHGISEKTAYRRIKDGDVQVVRRGTRCTRILVPVPA